MVPYITTDTFTVKPLEFPGGDIGSLAVNGTVNDLAVSGAEPRFLTLNAIIEEGLEVERLDRIVKSLADCGANRWRARGCGRHQSRARAAREAGSISSPQAWAYVRRAVGLAWVEFARAMCCWSAGRPGIMALP